MPLKEFAVEEMIVLLELLERNVPVPLLEIPVELMIILLLLVMRMPWLESEVNIELTIVLLPPPLI